MFISDSFLGLIRLPASSALLIALSLAPAESGTSAWLLEASAQELTGSDWQPYAKAGDEAILFGDFALAEAKFRSALALCKSKGAIPRLQVNYTNALMSQGKFALAGKELKKALSACRPAKGENSSDYAEALDLQSWLLQANGKMDQAVSSLKEAISILEKSAPQSSDLADAYEHMGQLSENLGLFDPAEANYEKALFIRQKLKGANGMQVADIKESLANIAAKRGKGNDAALLFQDALTLKETQEAPLKPYAPGPAEEAVVFSFSPLAPNCRLGSHEGLEIQSINANGVTVQAALKRNKEEFKKGTQALVRVLNQSGFSISVLPKAATLIQVTPKVQILMQLDAANLASKIEKKGESKAKWIKFWGADAMTQVSSTSYAQGRGVPVYGYLPGSFGWGGGAGNWANSYQVPLSGGNNKWSASSMSTSLVPDYQARQEAYRKAREAEDRSKEVARNLRESALGPMSLRAGDSVEGTLDFEFSKFTSAILRIPVGNAVFEFRFK